MKCRIGCAACCIAPSISSPIPGMPDGKPAGVRCIQLTEENRCRIFGRKERPAVCSSLKPSLEMCGETDAEAFEYLETLEFSTKPNQDLKALKGLQDQEGHKDRKVIMKSRGQCQPG